MKGTKWTSKEEEILREIYPEGGGHAAHRVLTNLGFDRTIKSVYARAKRLKMLTTNSGQFKPGHVPANKGKKMSEELKAKCMPTTFKKGQIPPNAKPIGTISIRKANGGQYKWIKVSKKKWQELHRYNWEQEHGKIPEGVMISFKDKDMLNCSLDNLESITREIAIRRNYNRDKAVKTRMQLTGQQVARKLAKGDTELQEELLKDKELITIARAGMLMKRAILKSKR